MFNQYDPTRGKWITPITFKINPEHSPLSLEDMVKATMQNVAMLRLFVDLSITYGGVTSRAPSKSPDGELVIGYVPASQFVATYGDYWAYANVWWTDSIYDANIAFNPSKVNTFEKFRSIQLHEWLHVLGFDHSYDKNSILFDKPYHQWEYQGLLRLVDMHALAAVYGKAPDLASLSPSTPVILYQGGQEINLFPTATSSLEARICVTDEFLIYIPSVVHPGTGIAHSVEMKFIGRINDMMRFQISNMNEVPADIDAVTYAYVDGDRLELREVFHFGSVANVSMKMVNGDENTWELIGVDYFGAT